MRDDNIYKMSYNSIINLSQDTLVEHLIAQESKYKEKNNDVLTNLSNITSRKELDNYRLLWFLSNLVKFTNYEKTNDQKSEEDFRIEKRQWTYYWLKILIRETETKGNPLITFHLDQIHSLGFDRETMIKNILYGVKKTKSKNREFNQDFSSYFKDESKTYDFRGTRHLQTICDYLISQRHNLVLGKRIVRKIVYLKSKSVNFLSLLTGLLVSLLSTFFIFVLYLTMSPHLITPFILSNNYTYISQELFPYVLLFIYFFIIFKLLNIVFIPLKAKLVIPRLFASIIVGYLPLVLTTELWQIALYQSFTLIATISISALFLTFTFLYFEVYKHIKDVEPIKIFGRVLVLFLHGLLYSLMIGVILVDWLSLYDAWYIPNFDIGYYLKGIFSIIPIKVLLLFSSLSIFLGFILQIFWEDKTITESI